MRDAYDRRYKPRELSDKLNRRHSRRFQAVKKPHKAEKASQSFAAAAAKKCKIRHGGGHVPPQ
jgi:hypothetical protein